MRIKQKTSSSLSVLKKIILNFFRFFSRRKTKIFFMIIFALIFFIIGTFSGMIFTKFLGTLDNPSQRAIDMLHFMGIYSLRDIHLKTKWILRENIKIPFNYIAGQFSKPEKIFINIDFKNYKKIEFKREQALERQALISSGDDYVPAKISYNNEEVKVKLRLKGDVEDHWNTDKWSFRIKVKDGDTLFGMKTFSIQAPGTRNYLNEFIYHKMLKKEGIVALRYFFIEVYVNGKNKGIYAVEEHFEKQLIENNNRREGIIIKFNEDLVGEEALYTKEAFKNLGDKWEYFKPGMENIHFHRSEIQTFDDEEIFLDPVLSKQFAEAKNLLNSFRSGLLKTRDIFDIGILAKYFAVNTLMAADHGSGWRNIRLYYNPVTSKIEPVGFDASAPRTNSYEIIDSLIPECVYAAGNCSNKDKSFKELIFMDELFLEKYIQELEKVSNISYLDNFFLEFADEIETNKKIIHKNNPAYSFFKEDLYLSQKQIQLHLNPVKSIKVHLKENNPGTNKIILSAANIGKLPIEIGELVYNNLTVFKLIKGKTILQPKKHEAAPVYFDFEFQANVQHLASEDNIIKNLNLNYKTLGAGDFKSESVLSFAFIEEDFEKTSFRIKKGNFNLSNFFKINNQSKTIFIKKGYLRLNKSVILPEGYSIFGNKITTIDLVNGAAILSYGDLHLTGTKENPFKIISSDGTGQGLAVLNADRQSSFVNVVFENLSSPSKENWELTGAVTIYSSPVKFDKVSFLNINSEDALNIISSEFKIKNSVFKNCRSDCLDVDFGVGMINSAEFISCGNDCLDFSGSQVEIHNVNLNIVGDKGISSGEKSNISINKIDINNCYIGAASKDLSEIQIININISNCSYGVSAYQKKSEFGPANIIAQDIFLSSNKQNYLIEKNSKFSMNNKIILTNEKNVYEKLYPEDN